ncbi:hypothetical protein [Roseimicrobium sp. ORNL1]|uniref:hypothetical protein n=1 Tax=Roseimicrobium sp. ORNL1 TaxID=2711231 RepID=UPI0013E1647B|nr:hypothetical protein [Roseimicrobium sp. ORNL1]QIF01345.1 hypothetical protein G5S37_07360 [Roseimicrobium sp. ORNL1]
MPILIGLVALVVFIVAEWRVRQRGVRVAIAAGSLLALAAAVWDFKNLEKQWEQHFLLYSTGQTFLQIEAMLERGEQAEVEQVLKKWESDGSLYHLSRVQLEDIREELFRNEPAGIEKQR